MELDFGYHRFSKRLAAMAAPTKANTARRVFMMLKSCASGRGVQMQERRSECFSMDQNERNQENRSERVLAAVSERAG